MFAFVRVCNFIAQIISYSELVDVCVCVCPCHAMYRVAWVDIDIRHRKMKTEKARASVWLDSVCVGICSTHTTKRKASEIIKMSEHSHKNILLLYSIS